MIAAPSDRRGCAPIASAAIPVAAQQDSWLEDVIRMDPVKFRVALPAADPPDNPNVDQA
ncbi:hypothetical protein [Bosea vaviloviae]|uniref:hypothetical protein n=1 Tax=Bosea vaviloviae TaxID=1526658 RepID=UPI0013142B0C|nr:hypothetical protein [Bosea vaviloviae]